MKKTTEERLNKIIKKALKKYKTEEKLWKKLGWRRHCLYDPLFCHYRINCKLK